MSADTNPENRPRSRGSSRLRLNLIAVLLLVSGLGLSILALAIGVIIRSEAKSAADGASIAIGSITESRQQRITALSEVGYLAGYHPVPRNTGVLVYSRGNAYDGYNFFTSGHGP